MHVTCASDRARVQGHVKNCEVAASLIQAKRTRVHNIIAAAIPSCCTTAEANWTALAIIMPLPRLLPGVSVPPSVGLSWSTTAFTISGISSFVRGLEPDYELASPRLVSVRPEPGPLIEPLVSSVAINPLFNVIQGCESSCCLQQWLLMYVNNYPLKYVSLHWPCTPRDLQEARAPTFHINLV